MLDWEIACAFDAVGTLWAREQKEADDEGVGYAERLMKLLRQYKAHEDEEASEEPDLPIDVYVDVEVYD